jgi:hypothetical protein
MKLNDFLDLITEKCNVGIMILDKDGIYYTTRKYDHDWLSRDCRLSNLSEMSITDQLNYLRSQNYDITEITSYFWEYDFLLLHVTKTESTETCTRSYDNGAPLNDEYWYYGTYFGCGKKLTEVKYYSHHDNPRSTVCFTYCPYCGKKLIDK